MDKEIFDTSWRGPCLPSAYSNHGKAWSNQDKHLLGVYFKRGDGVYGTGGTPLEAYNDWKAKQVVT